MAPEIRHVSGYDELERWVAARNAAASDALTPGMSALVRALELEHVDLIALEDGEPVGTAWLSGDPGAIATGRPLVEVTVRASSRGRGIGSALLAALREEARRRGYTGLHAEVREDDPAGTRFLVRRGFVVTGRRFQISLELADVELRAAEPPPGVELAWLAERPFVLDELWRVARAAYAAAPPRIAALAETQAAWQTYELASPLVRLDVTAIASEGDRVLGFSVAEDFPGHPLLFHRAIAVDPSARGRGVGTALVLAQIAAARSAELEALVATPRSDDVLRFFERLGYRPRKAWLELEAPL